MKKLSPAAVLVFLSWGCTPVEEPPPVSADLTEVGPYHVGYETISATWQDPYTGNVREIDVGLWYPSTTAFSDGSEAPVHLDTFEELGTTIGGLPIETGGMPTVLSLHGATSFGGMSYPIHQFVASHGFAVVAPNHLGDQLTDFGGGSIVQWYHRAPDATAALDAVEALPSSHPLHGRLDTSQVVAFGHSRGSFTTFALAGVPLSAEHGLSMCQSEDLEDCQGFAEAFSASTLDPRVVGLVPAAGSADTDRFGGQEALRQTELPILWMTATNDPVGVDALIAANPDLTQQWLELDGGCHAAWTLVGCEDLPPVDVGLTWGPYLAAFSAVHLFAEAPEQASSLLESPPSAARLSWMTP